MTHLILIALLSVAQAADRPLKAPPHTIAMVVEDVAPTAEGHVVFLIHPELSELVPVPVGESEAIAVAYRLAHRDRQRPLTHDLLDRIVRELDAEVVQVEIHSIQDGRFHARVTLRRKGRKRALVHFDARASDAIAIAIGNDLPVYLREDVFETAKISIDAMIETLINQSGDEARLR